MKKHLLTIRNGGGQVFTFYVTAEADADGKTRIPRSTLKAAMDRAGVTRGNCILIG